MEMSEEGKEEDEQKDIEFEISDVNSNLEEEKPEEIPKSTEGPFKPSQIAQGKPEEWFDRLNQSYEELKAKKTEICSMDREELQPFWSSFLDFISHVYNASLLLGSMGLSIDFPIKKEGLPSKLFISRSLFLLNKTGFRLIAIEIANKLATEAFSKLFLGLGGGSSRTRPQSIQKIVGLPLDQLLTDNCIVKSFNIPEAREREMIGNDEFELKKILGRHSRLLNGTLHKQENLLFYSNIMSSEPDGDFIEDILKTWKGDYRRLERHHGFIQWLFPNHYKSGFNSEAKKLSKKEAVIFKMELSISHRLVRSYELILDFFGMELVDKRTGELKRSQDYLKRFKATLKGVTHNHLRVRRILTHLNNVGFRNYGIELVEFLKKEIYDSKGELQDLQKFNSFRDWVIYGRIDGVGCKEESLLRNCFVEKLETLEEKSAFILNLENQKEVEGIEENPKRKEEAAKGKVETKGNNSMEEEFKDSKSGVSLRP